MKISSKKLLVTIIIPILFILETTSCVKRKENLQNILIKSNLVSYSAYFTVDTTNNTLEITYPTNKKVTIIIDTIRKNSVKRNDTIYLHTVNPSVIIGSTTFIGFLNVLDVKESIVGIQNKNIVYDSTLFKKIEANEIKDVQTPEGLDLELILKLKPTIVFLSYMPGNNILPTIQKIESNGIIVIQIPDWLETHPLGRMEWIKAFSIIFNKKSVAFSYANLVFKGYENIKKSVSHKSFKPKVMIGLSFNDQWYVPSGNGYFGRLLFDAGFNYPFAKTTQNQSIPLSKEEIITTCSDAEYWLNVTTAKSIKEVQTIERLAPTFQAFKNKNVFNYTKKLLQRGANDFWESGVVNPHIVLKDLVWIASGTPSNYIPIYYTKLQ